MTDQYLGEMRIVGFSFAPFQWATAQGQIISIQQNAALFSLLGTTFGGNGTSNFALPNYGGRIGVSSGTGPGLTQRVIGEEYGEANVTLLVSNLPPHTHPVTLYKPNPGTTTPAGVLGVVGKDFGFLQAGTVNTTFAPQMIGVEGSSLPHSNEQPYLAMTWTIALSGIFPSFN